MSKPQAADPNEAGVEPPAVVRPQPSGVAIQAAPVRPAWAAVVSMALGVFALVTAEFLPASLLTPMAASLGVTEGAAGQSVTATAAAALVSSLLVPAGIRNLDRRVVLAVFSVLLLCSNLLVALAPNLTLLLLARMLLGLALGGFWAISAALTMRLVPEPLVPRALAVLFSGVSLATISAAPAGSYLGHLLGWRAVFVVAAGLAAAALITQLTTLPRLVHPGSARLGTLIDVLRRPGISTGIGCAMLVFSGHFAFFTYIRPYLEDDGVGIGVISGVLLGFGLANFAGTLLAGPLLESSLRIVLLAMPLLMSVIAVGLVVSSHEVVRDAVMVAFWGFAFGMVPVAWSTWLTRAVPDETESAGGLLVAAIQLAISVGAAGGGLVFDLSGTSSVFLASGAALLLAALIIWAGVRSRPEVAGRS